MCPEGMIYPEGHDMGDLCQMKSAYPGGHDVAGHVDEIQDEVYGTDAGITGKIR